MNRAAGGAGADKSRPASQEHRCGLGVDIRRVNCLSDCRVVAEQTDTNLPNLILAESVVVVNAGDFLGKLRVSRTPRVR